MDKLTIKQWRLAKEVTQEQLADVCKVHRNTIASWEENPDKIPIGAAYSIVERLGVTIDQCIFLPTNSTECRI